MRITSLTCSLIFLVLMGCDNSRVFEKNKDLKDQYWLINNKPFFEFDITDTTEKYNLYCNIRNEVSYPKSNIYLTYSLSDTLGNELEKKLVQEFLFDKKTGEPFGKSGLGDIYDHQILLLKNYSFKKSDRYKVTFEQLMRLDTLPNILAVGLRVEKAE